MQSRNRVTAAKFQLIDIVDIDSATEVRPLEMPATRRSVYPLEEAIDVALRRSPAREARVLAKEKLEIERSTLQQGLSSTFQLGRFAEALMRAQNAEVGALIDYANALTVRDPTLGATMETRDIGVEQVGR